MRRRKPTPAERAAQKQQLEAKRASLRARIQRRPRVVRPVRKKKKKEKSKNSRWLWLLLLLLLPLCLVRDCSCTPDLPGPAEEVAAPTGPAEPEPAPPELPSDRIARQDRDAFAAEPPPPLPWIASFRMQVAARSPRLSECFVGAQEPGRLKWTTSVEPRTGQVSEHTLEPMLGGISLSKRERDCVLAALEEPAYTLPADGERTTPARVGIVIEF